MNWDNTLNSVFVSSRMKNFSKMIFLAGKSRVKRETLSSHNYVDQLALLKLTGNYFVETFVNCDPTTGFTGSRAFSLLHEYKPSNTEEKIELIFIITLILQFTNSSLLSYVSYRLQFIILPWPLHVFLLCYACF